MIHPGQGRLTRRERERRSRKKWIAGMSDAQYEAFYQKIREQTRKRRARNRALGLRHDGKPYVMPQRANFKK